MYKNLRLFFVTLGIVFSVSSASAAQIQKKYIFENLTVVVPSCDKYSELWHPFFTQFFKHWPSLMSENKHVPVILIGNKKKYESDRVHTLSIENEISWSDNMIAALKRVKTDYVLLSLEDYIFNHPVDEARLYELFEGVKAVDAGYLQVSYNDPRFHYGPPHETIPGVCYRDKSKRYSAGAQVGIWRTEDLLALLKSGENAWKFEVDGSIRAQSLKRIFLSVRENEPIRHLNAVHLGYTQREVLEYIEAQGIDMSARTLPIEDEHWWPSFKKWAYIKLYWSLGEPWRKFKEGNTAEENPA